MVVLGEEGRRPHLLLELPARMESAYVHDVDSRLVDTAYRHATPFQHAYMRVWREELERVP